jgi:L-asparaginase
MRGRRARRGRTPRRVPRGPIAAATPASVEWFAAPWRPDEPARFAWPDAAPPVPILHAFQGMDAGCVEQALAGGARGIVLAGFGHGNMPAVVRTALAGAVRAGVPVVRSTRVDEGLVDREPGDDEAGFIAARALGPAKARVLLQLLVAARVTNPLVCQAAFDRR